MKKILSIWPMFVLFALCVDAQMKKTWDFSAGLSPQNIGHLNADVTWWAENVEDIGGNVNNKKKNNKPGISTPLMGDGTSSQRPTGCYSTSGTARATASTWLPPSCASPEWVPPSPSLFLVNKTMNIPAHINKIQ